MPGRFKKLIRERARASVLRSSRERLVNTSVTVFSSNCVGAVVCHDFGMRFNSPMVNLFMMPDDYLRFLNNLKYYLSLDVIDGGTSEWGGYPVGLLGDVKLHFVHYPSFEVARQKWIARVKRVDLNNCCAIMIDRDGCTPKMAKSFDALPFERKVFLTYRPIEDCSSVFVEPSWLDSGSCQTADICTFLTPISARRKLDSFDWVNFFNEAGKYCG